MFGLHVARAGILGSGAMGVIWTLSTVVSVLGASVGSVAAVDVALGVGSAGFAIGALAASEVPARVPARRVRQILVPLCAAGAGGQALAMWASSPAQLVIALALAHVGAGVSFAGLNAEAVRRVGGDMTRKLRANKIFTAISTLGVAAMIFLAPRVANAVGSRWVLLPPLVLLLGACVQLWRWWRWGGEDAAPLARQAATHRLHAAPLVLACLVLAIASAQHNPWLNGVERAFVAGGVPPSRTGDVLALATGIGAAVVLLLPSRWPSAVLAFGGAAAAAAYFLPGLGSHVSLPVAFAATIVLRTGTIAVYASAPPLAGRGNESRVYGLGNVAKGLGGMAANLELARLATVEARVLEGRVASVALVALIVVVIAVDRCGRSRG